MAFEFLGNQKIAIETPTHNFIVSAGAGSGKTAVLTERIARLLKTGIKASQLLVLTFTNLAATEMKERVIKKMLKDEQLKDRITEVDSAYITTFDSFSLSIVKKYHEKLNIDKEINIIDSSIMNVKKRKTLEEVFLEFYLKEKPSFIKLISDVTVKDDFMLKKEILSMTKKIDLIYNKEAFFDSYIDKHYNEKVFEELLKGYVELILEKIELLKKGVDDLSIYINEKQNNKYKANFVLLFSAKNYDDIKVWSQTKLSSLSSLENEAKKIYANNKNICNEIVKMCYFKDEKEIKKSYYSSKDYVEEIIRILKAYYQKLDAFKKEKNAYEFSDIAKMAIDLVSKHQDIKEELTNNFKEILIDEYQDTSDLQEEFISKISNNNVYMVGDIKQSIYGFRNANPFIFKNKYDNYKKGNGGDKIDLTTNFRSNRPVLFVINQIFNKIMDDTIGNADFEKEHQMRFGLEKYLQIGSENKIKFISYHIEKEDKKNIKPSQVDMFYVLKDIKEKIDNKVVVYDKETDTFRPCQYKDFAILSPDSKLFDDISMLLSYNDIPNTIYKNVDVGKSNIIYVIKNLLKLITMKYNDQLNQEFKKCFYSVGRSFLFEYSDEELFTYVTKNKYKNSKLYEIVDKYSKLIDSLSIYELCYKLLEEIDITNKIIKIKEVSNNITRVEYLLRLISSIESLELDLFDFVECFDDVLKNQDSMEFAFSDTGENSVKLMTIHKSKGLEFPIVYFVCNDKGFNKSELKDKFLYDSEYGFIAPIYIDGLGKNINYHLCKEKYNDTLISEKIRLLYVALTRAREQMIVIYQDDKMEYDNHPMVDLLIRKNYNSFSDIFNSVKFEMSSYIEKINPLSLGIDDSYLQSVITNVKDIIVPNNIKISNIKNSYSIIEEEIERASKTNKQMKTKEEIENMKFGTQIHQLFECVDFNNLLLDGLTKQEKNYITNFLNQPVLKNIKKGKIYKEHEFSLNDDGKQVHGIIDLFIEYDNYVDIIDYKLYYVDDNEYKNQLNKYKNYIQQKTQKEVNIYLYSIGKNEMKKI